MLHVDVLDGIFWLSCELEFLILRNTGMEYIITHLKMKYIFQININYVKTFSQQVNN